MPILPTNNNSNSKAIERIFNSQTPNTTPSEDKVVIKEDEQNAALQLAKARWKEKNVVPMPYSKGMADIPDHLRGRDSDQRV